VTGLTELALAVIAAYLLLCLFRPVTRCPRCGGRKIVRHGRGFAPCGWCKGHGRAPLPGARLVHRTAWEFAAPWIRGRLRDAAERLRGEP
jgi:hypothetical protein